MCGRYALYGPIKDGVVLDRVNISKILNQEVPRFNLAPTQLGPVIARGRTGVEVKNLRWGLIPSWSKDDRIASHTINARVETVAEKPAFRSALKKRRCLVPMSGYFEWKGEKGAKQPFFIFGETGRLLLAAGLWEAWRPSDGADPVRTFTILTGKPGVVSGNIHDRQPVFLPPNAWLPWLDPASTDALTLLRNLPEEPLTYFPVSKAVNAVRNQGKELIDPIDI